MNVGAITIIKAFLTKVKFCATSKSEASERQMFVCSTFL